jgi:uronate dehydrogenase
LVFTRTVMVYGGYDREKLDEPLHPARHAWPTTYYAVSKMHGEHLARMYVGRFRMSAVCVRLGWFPRPPVEAENVKGNKTVLSVDDCKRLFIRGVEAEDIDFCVVNGFSREGADQFDLETGKMTIGYEPQDDPDAAYRQHAERFGWPVEA